MRHLRFVARRPLRLLLAICLGLTGCSDEPNLPAGVEEAARRRAQEEEQAEQELEREREKLRRAAIETSGSSTIANARVTSPASDQADVILSDDSASKESAEISDPASNSAAATVEPPPTPSPPVPPRNRTTAMKWSQMKAGMTPAEVRKLLGQPTRQSQDFFLTYWYYGAGQSAGKIAFISQSQRTMAWDLPLE